MEDIIILRSRDGTDNRLKRLKRSDGEESKTYILKTTIPIMRSGYIEETKKFIDPSGGPMIVEGYTLKEADAVVKSIDFISGYGHTITFE